MASLGRHVRPDEARLYWKYAGLVPSDAVAWISEHIGPYDAGRAMAQGLCVADVLQTRAVREQETARIWEGISTLEIGGWAALGCDSNRARQWKKLGCAPDQAETWLTNGFVTASDASRWSSIGVDPVDARAWREANVAPEDAREWISVGEQPTAQVWFVPTPSAAAALQWRAVGLHARHFAAWWSTGLQPVAVADAVAAGRLPTEHDEVVAERRSHVIVWAVVHDSVQLGMLDDFEYIRDSMLETNAALGCSTWAELRDVVGSDELERAWGGLLDAAWEEQGTGSAAGVASPRPDDWLPGSSVPDLSGDWLASRPRFDDPDLLTLPEFIMGEATGCGSPVNGDFVWWDIAEVPTLAALARDHGYTFVQRQDLIDG